MKLNDRFINHKMDNTALVVPVAGVDFHGVIQGNKTVGVILDCLEQGTTEEEIVSALCERYDGDIEEIRADVADVLKKLRSIGAIDD